MTNWGIGMCWSVMLRSGEDRWLIFELQTLGKRVGICFCTHTGSPHLASMSHSWGHTRAGWSSQGSALPSSRDISSLCSFHGDQRIPEALLTFFICKGVERWNGKCLFILVGPSWLTTLQPMLHTAQRHLVLIQVANKMMAQLRALIALRRKILPPIAATESEKVSVASRVQLFVIPWRVAHQAALPMGFFRQKYWIGQSFSSPGDLPYSGIELRSPALCADSLLAEPPGKPLGWPCPSCPSGTLPLDPDKPSPLAQTADSKVTSCAETSLFTFSKELSA